MKVPFIDLHRTFDHRSSEYEEAMLDALRSGYYVLGDSDYCGPIATAFHA